MTQQVKQTVGGNGLRFTATPLAEAVAKASDRPDLNSEFCRPGDCHRLFGLKRGFIYNLEKEGVIRTCSLRRPGQIKGVKLIHVASVRQYLHGLMEAGQPA